MSVTNCQSVLCNIQEEQRSQKYYSDINITYENNYISKVNDLKFLGLNISNTLSWKTHIDKILPKLSSACFAMRSVKPFVSQQTQKVITTPTSTL